MADLSTLARPYAKAAFELAKEEGTLKQWGEALDRLAAAVQSSEVSGLIGHPAVAKDPLYDVGKVARVGVGGRRPSAMASAGSPLDLALALQAYAPPATQGPFDRS